MNNAKQSLHEYLQRHSDARDAFRSYIAEQCEVLRNQLESGPIEHVADTRAQLRATRALESLLSKATQGAKRRE
jgi:ketopantoate reductase